MGKVINLFNYLDETGSDNLAEQLRWELEHELIGDQHVKAEVVVDILKRMGYEEDVNLVKVALNRSEEELKEMVIVSADDVEDDQLTLAEHLIANTFEDPTNITYIRDNPLVQSRNLHPSVVQIKYYMDDHKRYVEGKTRISKAGLSKFGKKSFYLLVEKVYFENTRDIEPKMQLYFIYHEEKEDNN